MNLANNFYSTFFQPPFPLLWDRTFESWRQLGVLGQPSGMLLDSDGQIVDSWFGDIPRSRVLDAIDDLGA